MNDRACAANLIGHGVTVRRARPADATGAPTGATPVARLERRCAGGDRAPRRMIRRMTGVSPANAGNASSAVTPADWGKSRTRRPHCFVLRRLGRGLFGSVLVLDVLSEGFQGCSAVGSRVVAA